MFDCIIGIHSFPSLEGKDMDAMDLIIDQREDFTSDRLANDTLGKIIFPGN